MPFGHAPVVAAVFILPRWWSALVIMISDSLRQLVPSAMICLAFWKSSDALFVVAGSGDSAPSESTME